MATAPAGTAGIEKLRPLELGELLDRTFTIYRRQFLTFVIIVAAPYLVLVLCMVPIGILAPAMVKPGAGAAFSPAFVLAMVITVVLYLLAYAASHAASFFAASDAYLDRAVTVAGAYRQAKEKIGRLINTALTVGIRVLGGFILLIVPGIIVMCRASVAVPAAMLEDLSASDAFRRSWELTKGFAGRAGAILGLSFIISMVAQYILQFPLQLAAEFLKGSGAATILNALASLWSVLGAILAAPVAFIASTLFYYDLRVRKEGFDLERLVATLGGAHPLSASLVPRAFGPL